MEQLIKFYDSYFDEDSGNTREEGIKQLQSYLKEESQSLKASCTSLKKELDKMEKELETRVMKGENINAFIPIISLYRPIFFIVFTVFSFCISFKLIDFNIDYLIFNML